jgi:hypothetical protein
MTNAAFSRPLLSQVKAAGASIATDLQTASESSRAYDTDFLRAADVIFLSQEKLAVEPETFVSTLWERTGARVVVVGMGASGALLRLRRGKSRRVSAISVRPIVNTAGRATRSSPVFCISIGTGRRHCRRCGRPRHLPGTRWEKTAPREGSCRRRSYFAS